MRKRNPTGFKAKASTPASRKTVAKIMVTSKNGDGMVKYFEQMEDNTISGQENTQLGP